MKRVYALLVNVTLLSSYGVAKTTTSKNSKIDAKYETNKNSVAIHKSTKLSDYKVQNGDTLFVIARKHHTTISEVESANSMEKGENLKIGRSLKVPVDTYFPEKTKKVTKIADYKVQNGDTLFIIARKHHTTISEVESANSMEKGESLKVGRSLKVPVDTYFPEKTKEVTKVASSKKASSHTVKSGDSLSQIAEQYSVTVDQL